MVSNCDKLGNVEKLFYFICGFTLFFTTAVFYGWHNSNFNFLRYSYLYLLVFFVVKSKISAKNVLFVILFSFLFLWEKFFLDLNIIGFLLPFLFPFILLIRIQERLRILDNFILIVFPLLIGVSVLSYVLWSFGLINLPGTYVENINASQNFDFISHLFFVTPTNLIDKGRFFCFYDEPGVIGTLSATIVFFYKRKLPNWAFFIYFVAGVLSFSFYFFGIMLFYFIVNNSSKLSKKVLVLVFSIGIVIVIFSWFDSDFVYSKVYNRFMIEDGELVGLNRNNDYFSHYFYNSFIGSDEFYWGAHDISVNSQSVGSFSTEVMIYRYGIFYVLFATLLYISFFYKYKVSYNDFFQNVIVWLILNYQRPCYTELFYFVFFTTIIQSNYYNINLSNKNGLQRFISW